MLHPHSYVGAVLAHHGVVLAIEHVGDKVYIKIRDVFGVVWWVGSMWESSILPTVYVFNFNLQVFFFFFFYVVMSMII